MDNHSVAQILEDLQVIVILSFLAVGWVFAPFFLSLVGILRRELNHMNLGPLGKRF